MKKNYQVIVGFDVAKAKLDYCILPVDRAGICTFGCIQNTEKAIKHFINCTLRKEMQQDILFCLENTGVYSMPVSYWLQQAKLDYWVVSALEVKRSKGICRGKTDKADSKDVALYALSHLHQLQLSVLPEKDFLQLRLLLAEREKLIKSVGIFKTTNENINFLPANILKSVLAHNKKTIALLQQQLKRIELLLQDIIANNKLLKEQSDLLQTVPGIGPQTCINLIAYTNAFSSFKNWRKFACYCGIAPFAYESGSRVRGRTKVNHIANKKLKSLLNLAALSAKRTDVEIKQYFERKVKEGKNKMLVLNAIRCKIVSRAFAVIQRNTPFVDLCKFAAAS